MYIDMPVYYFSEGRVSLGGFGSISNFILIPLIIIFIKTMGFVPFATFIHK